MTPRRMRGFGSLSITTYLTLLFTLVSVIPLCALGVLSLRISSENMIQRGVADRLNRLEFIDYRTVELMRQKHRDVLLAAFNKNIRSYFDENTTYDSFTLIEDQAKRQVIGLYNKQEATSSMLVGNDGTGLIYGAVQSSAVARIDARERVDFDLGDFELFDRWDDPTYEDGECVIPYERLVLALSDNRPVARLVVNVKESIFGALYQDYEAEADSEFFIVNGHGAIMSCSDKSLCGRTVQDALGFDLDQCQGESGYVRIGKSIVTYRNNLARGLLFLERTDEARYTSGFWPIVKTTVTVALMCVALCAALGAALSRGFTKPLYRLIERVSRFETSEPGGKDRNTKNEITILSDKYAHILGELESVIADYYEEQRKKKEAQIRALEFQINPHFLYNTLSTIIWLIDAGEDRSAIRVTKDLSAFFRISISKGRNFITIREELQHVVLYINIQKARYADCIFVEYQVDEEILKLLTPKLVLQPLVENSIIHAMQTRADKTCHIKITARRESEKVIFEVIDNGDRITEQTIKDMNLFLHHREAAGASGNYGIGISNVHDRIVMSFGEGCGLTYRREGDETIAELTIRVTEDNQDV